MATREKITQDGKQLVHFLGFGQKDYALCGQDLAGDNLLGYEASQTTNEKVNCPDCIEIVVYCKKIKYSEYHLLNS
ncbi:hypothetical protein SAMN05421780_11062 [Flexibacter flexilis DSM 6793]|uniref:Uncharacterized protein n=1 Tax=Flexibacter flexilis DSM 6793 TaxID=927664 RepID=A0A1I1M790_9BACT|nr:hypothetical protein [Flexibacter flexilis]SFC81269.1 hypothetical protein SAMN05421780_11062 [Flexibacter flexilis DSM 6793]